ncbi:MAG: FG-GAP repeat protein [Planctomycetia bacterium]|nr:FG-GAP repeat protein [Planctomycetia bacterium]
MRALFTTALVALLAAGCGGGGSGGGTDGGGPAAPAPAVPGGGTSAGLYAPIGLLLDEVQSSPEWGHGTALALADADGDGDLDVFAGYPGNEIDGLDDAGAVWIYLNSPTGFGVPVEITARDWWPTEPQVGGRFGMYLYAGDFDGDGFDDVAIGAPSEDVDGVVDAGRVYIRFGTGDGLGLYAGPFGDPSGGETGAEFGGSFAAGDVTGDGIDDLTVGSPGATVGTVRGAGHVWVFVGDDPFAIGDQVIGPATEAQARTDGGCGALIVVDDLDGDGRGEVLAAGPGTRTSAGRVTAFGLDVARRLVPRTTFPVPAGGANSLFGAGMVTDDFDGDGDVDVAIGAPYATCGGVAAAGFVAIYENRTLGSTLAFAPGRVFGDVVPTSGAQFGALLNVADADGDERVDLVVGAPGTRIGGLEGAGRLHVLLQDDGWAFGVPGRRVVHAPTPSVEGAAFGAWIEVGDVTGDGLDDLVTGAPGPYEDGLDLDLRRPGFVEVLPARP